MAVYTQIDNPELYFQCKLYTGTGSAASITLDGDEDMQPDLVWFKKRSSTESHYVYDAVRGVTKEIYANSTAAELMDTPRSDIPVSSRTFLATLKAFSNNWFKTIPVELNESAVL